MSTLSALKGAAEFSVVVVVAAAAAFGPTAPRLARMLCMGRHTVSKLIGSPPGYVGYDEAGQGTPGPLLLPGLCSRRIQAKRKLWMKVCFLSWHLIRSLFSPSVCVVALFSMQTGRPSDRTCSTLTAASYAQTHGIAASARVLVLFGCSEVGPLKSARDN